MTPERLQEIRTRSVELRSWKAFVADMINELIDAIPQWQPIETAPKDGTRFIGYAFGEEIDIATWDNAYGRFDWEPVGEFDIAAPTRWMPLPEPPAEQ